LVALPNELGVSRFGFTVGRRVGNAVARNKVKRRLREVARHSDVADGWDLVVLARKDAASADYRQLGLDMADLLRRARLLESVELPETAPSTSR
jgi:ribonuclease P protein component